MVYTQFMVEGYKRLRSVNLPLRDLTVFVGPNGAGKSALLECMELVARSADRQLTSALVDLGGIAAVRTRSQEARPEALRLRGWFLDTPPGAYDLEVVVRAEGHGIQSEYLGTASSDSGVAPLIVRRPGQPVTAQDPRLEGEPPTPLTYDGAETLLSQLPEQYRTCEALRRVFASLRTYRPADAGPGAAIRLPQQLRPASLPHPSGKDLASALHQKRAGDRWMYDRLEGVLRTAYPGFEGLEMPLVAAGVAMLTWRERGQVYYANELSEGTLRFMLLACALLTTEPPAMLLIDEPEVSLHPELIKILSDLLVDASARTQVIVATQSPELVSWLKPEQIVVLDLDDDGWCRATPGSKMDLASWLEDYTLGQLWTKGVIGGRP